MSSSVTADSLVSTPHLGSSSPTLGTISSSPCEGPSHIMTQYLLQQQQPHSVSPEHPAPASSSTPEKLDVNVDISAFYGLQDKMTGFQEKVNYYENNGGNAGGNVGIGGEDWNNFTEILEMQRKRLVKAKRHRSENVSERDKILFLNILGPKVDTIENRRVGGTSKMQMWREIEAQFNESAEVERTYDQLRELWKRLKIAMKKELEVGRQKGFAPLPASITRTFSLLKDFDFVDDVNNSGVGCTVSSAGGGCAGDDDMSSHHPTASTNAAAALNACVDMQQPGSPYSSPYKASLDNSTASDSSDTALLNAFHLSSLFAKREDGKTLAERLAQADLSLTSPRLQDTSCLTTPRKQDNTSLSLVERITHEKRDEAKALAERLAHSELGQDLTITQVNTTAASSAAGGGISLLQVSNNNNSSISRQYDPDDNTDSKEGILKLVQQNNDCDVSESYVDVGESKLFLKCLPEQELSSVDETMNAANVLLSNSSSSGCNNNSVSNTSPVPDLVKLQKSLGLSCVATTTTSNSGVRCRETSRGLKRKLESVASAPVGGQQLLASNVNTAPVQPAAPPTSAAAAASNSSVTDAQFASQRLRNEQQKGRLIKVQLENENIRNALLKHLMSKLKEGDESLTLQALKAIVS